MDNIAYDVAQGGPVVNGHEVAGDGIVKRYFFGSKTQFLDALIVGLYRLADGDHLFGDFLGVDQTVVMVGQSLFELLAKGFGAK